MPSHSGARPSPEYSADAPRRTSAGRACGTSRPRSGGALRTGQWLFGCRPLWLVGLFTARQVDRPLPEAKGNETCGFFPWNLFFPSAQNRSVSVLAFVENTLYRGQQRWDILPHDINEDLAGHAIIGVDEDVPDVRHGAPRDLCVGQAKRVIAPASCLADDFQVAADRVVDHRHARPRGFDTPCVVENPLATLANMHQVQARVLSGHDVRVLSLPRGPGRECRDGASGSRPRRSRYLVAL